MNDRNPLPDYFSTLKILIVDDQVYMRELIQSILLGLKIKDIRQAGDGEAALREIEIFQPGLIFTDWNMKPMNGTNLVRNIRKGKKKGLDRYVPIIMLTGYNQVKRITEARDAGANDFLVKPVSPKTIYSRVRMTMEHPRPFVGSSTYFGSDRRRKDIGPPKGAAEQRGTVQKIKSVAWLIAFLLGIRSRSRPRPRRPVSVLSRAAFGE